MKDKIESYVDYISVDDNGDLLFSGDGSHEQFKKATKLSILDYIVECEDQLKLAKQALGVINAT
jgi:hypothetical protein